MAPVHAAGVHGAFLCAEEVPILRLLHLLPLLVSGVLLDVGRWRMRQRLNEARQAAFQWVNNERIEHQARLVKDLLALRRRTVMEMPQGVRSQRMLDHLVIAQHDHLSSLHRRAGDSDLMAPLLTGAYTDEFGVSTWSASLQREWDARDQAR